MELEEIRQYILKTLETNKSVEIDGWTLYKKWTEDGPIKDHEFTQRIIEFAGSSNIKYEWMFPDDRYFGKAVMTFKKDKH